MTFICEDGPHLVVNAKDRVIVSLDLMTADNQTRIRRVQLRKMCKEHALEWIGRMDVKPTGEQVGLW